MVGRYFTLNLFTLIMPETKRKLCKLISGNSIFCSFCLNDIKNEKSCFVEDEITLETGISMQLTDLISSVLGSKFENMTTSGLICQECMKMLIKSYKFIEMCKQNAEQLYNTIETLENSLKSVVMGTNHQSLFVSLNTWDYTSQLIYDDDKPSPTNCLKALKRWHQLSHVHKSLEIEIIKSEFSIDMEPLETYYNDIIVKEKPNIKIKQNKKKNRNKIIPISKMIYDTDNMSQYKCKVCHKTYSNLNRLKQHFLRVHAPKDFKCTLCSRKYGSVALLTQHKYDSHSPMMCSYCGKSYTCRSTFKTHMQSHQLKLICQICGKIFRNKRNFATHMKLNICNPILRKINLEKKYICDYCNKVYSSKSSLRVHIKFKHGNGVAHVCSWCNKKFDAVSRLASHIVTHTQEKKFSCDLCGGRFVTKESLLYHTRTHTGEKPYQCEHCDQRFLSASRRSEHVRRHHNDPTMECDVCHSKFKSRSCLTRHKKRHFNLNSRLHYSRIQNWRSKAIDVI